ncbi:MAG: encapsidation protein [Candidatus Moranbacteria bacterium GW2011_GWF2_35_39]|nr:MAG: encapsidation protein [Candidatus Moranbacteria bacterium GW2011_GWF2_35_39]
MAKELTKDIWYDINRLLSFKALISVVVGMRGGGKTYGAKKRCIIDFKEKGQQFVWLRRYDSELFEAKKTFFNAIRNDPDLNRKYPDMKLHIIGNKVYIDDEVAGYFIALTLAHKFKSSDFPLVVNIVYDEFIPDDSSRLGYLRSEVTALYNLIETIQRQRDTTRVIMIANAISFGNPYFIAWRVKPFRQEFLHLKSMSIVIQMYYNEAFANYKQDTRFGKLTAGTEYSQFAIMNKFADDNDVFIGNRTEYAKYRCTVKYEGETYGFWIDFNEGLIFASSKVDPSCPHSYTLSQKDHDINYLLVKNVKGTYVNEIVEGYKLGILRFESIMIKSRVLEMLTLFIR